MLTVIALLEKITPLYMLIILGFCLARLTPLKKEMISFPLIYLIAPVVFFSAAYSAHLSAATLSLPILFFVICSLICVSSLWISRSFLPEADVRNIFAFMNGETNVAFFGIPAAAALYGGTISSIVALCALGFAFYESTVGYYVAARGKSSAAESLRKLLHLPTVYAFLLGCVCNVAGIHLGGIGVFNAGVTVAKFALTFVGMMLIGFATASLKVREFDLKFLSAGLFVRFVVWPMLAITLIILDAHFWHIYSPDAHTAILLISALPTAASSVVFATQLRNNPEKISAVVLVTTTFALLYIPFITAIFGHLVA